MGVYLNDIQVAAVAFPFIAALITLPYLIVQYRRLGSIPWQRSLIVYSFVFYCLCAYFLIILPLPANHSAYVPYAAHPQLIPFNFVHELIEQSGFSITNPSTWLGLFRQPTMYETVFNLLMLAPLGMYLRYWFRRRWWQALLIGFAVSLFFELSQLSGLWGLYAHPYRLFDVDDLMANSLGALLGFWMVGPALRVLPDRRIIDEEAREIGIRAGAFRRMFSFGIDVALAGAVCGLITLGLSISGLYDLASASLAQHGLGDDVLWQTIGTVLLIVMLVVIPTLTHGQTLGQKLLRLRMVRPDVSRAHWYQYLARYGLLYLVIFVPLFLILGLLDMPTTASESGTVASFLTHNRRAVFIIWAVCMGAWVLSLAIRAFLAWRNKQVFVMLNGVLSNTRVMTEAGVARECERRHVLSVAEVVALEQRIAEDGTPLATLMEQAGKTVAHTVRAWVPDPAPVVILTGSGNNGGDGWVCAHELACAGWPVVLIAPDLAERIHTEPARSTAMDVFADATAQNLPLSVLIAPDTDVLNQTIDGAKAIVDAMLGTGFSGEVVREPYASWIRAANRRRFEGSRKGKRGAHRQRAKRQGAHARLNTWQLIPKAKDAPLALSVDAPSGLSAETGEVAQPCFMADITVTMLANKPGLATKDSATYTGVLHIEDLGVDLSRYRTS